MSKTTLFDSRIKKYAYREAAQIYKEIGVSPDGLSREQVEEMREQYGANSFAERKNDTMVCRLRRAFINPFNVILFILGIISLVTDVLIASDFARNASTAIIIFTMILISGAIRLVQELRVKNAAQQLDRLIHESITVRRGGELIEIPAEKLVVGDIVLLSAGDRVPADIRLTSVTDLFISQAAITGESAILEKTCRTLSYSSPKTLTQLENLVFMATTVISGKGEGIVLAVGKDTLYGSFAKPESEDKQSFQRGANSIAWVMLRFIVVLIPSVFVLLGVTGGGGGTDAGDAADGDYRLPCKGQFVHEPQADHHQGHQCHAGIWQYGCAVHGQDRNADQREHPAGILHGCAGQRERQGAGLCLPQQLFPDRLQEPDGFCHRPQDRGGRGGRPSFAGFIRKLCEGG